jgi:hypothetical protein
MSRIDDDPLGPGFRWRLRAALDPVKPPFSPPRYPTAGHRPIAWRVAPAMLAVAAIFALSVTAFAATGSPNPAIWTQRAVSAIDSAAHAPQTFPAAQPTPEPSDEPAKAAPAAPARSTHEDEGQSQSEPKESPEPSSNHSSGSSDDRPGSNSTPTEGTGSD